MSLSKKLNRLLTEDTSWRKFCINLNASENYMSSCVRGYLNHYAYENYQFPPPGGRILGPSQFDGNSQFDQIISHIENLGKDLLGVSTLIPLLRGGQLAEIAILLAFTDKKKVAFYVQESDGGHFGLSYIAKKAHINLIPLLFDKETHLLDIGKNLNLIRESVKKDDTFLITLNQSFILKKQCYYEFSNMIKENFPNCILSCDVSHVLGLIIGKTYPNPLDEGFDVMHGSTHKTFPGPQKAIICTKKNDSLVEKISDTTIPGRLQSYCGTAEIYALAVALEEMQVFGQQYAIATCNNAKFMAKELANLKLNIVGEEFGYTETHQVWIKCNSENEAWHACSLLHDAHIRVIPAYLPFVDQWGIRLGVNAMTRRGFCSDEFRKVAIWINDILTNVINPEEVAEKVNKLLNYFPIDRTVFSFTE